MKRYVTPNDMKRIENTKGQIIESSNGVFLVKTSDIYTVWIPETGLMITNTFYVAEAAVAFEKYSKREV